MAAYFIFTHKVLDADTLNNNYLPKAVESLQPYEPEILAVDENIEVIEGDTSKNRTVILKFKRKEDAKAWYNSPEYQAIVNLRTDSVDGIALICEEFVPG